MAARNALVTGGSRGIGLEIARQLLNAGHHVTITGRDESNLREAAASLEGPSRLSWLALDATDHERTEHHLTRLAPDILVANAGIAFSAKFTETSLSDWARVMDVNATGPFVALRATLPAMMRRRWGRVVTVGSIASHQSLRYGSAYAASKHALWGLTRTVAEETADSGVRVNMVAPSFVRTDMTRENAARIAAAGSRSVAEAEGLLARVSDLGRLLEPEEVAAEVMDMVDEEAPNGTLRILGGKPGALP